MEVNDVAIFTQVAHEVENALVGVGGLNVDRAIGFFLWFLHVVCGFLELCYVCVNASD